MGQGSLRQQQRTRVVVADGTSRQAGALRWTSPCGGCPAARARAPPMLQPLVLNQHSGLGGQRRGPVAPEADWGAASC